MKKKLILLISLSLFTLAVGVLVSFNLLVYSLLKDQSIDTINKIGQGLSVATENFVRFGIAEPIEPLLANKTDPYISKIEIYKRDVLFMAKDFGSK